MQVWFRLLFSTIVMLSLSSIVVSAEDEPTREELLEERMNYYVKYASPSLPWYYLAAVDQYERNIQQVRIDIPKKEGAIAINFTEEFWAGALNPFPEDTSLVSLAFFNGNGRDGNGDGYANADDPDDALSTIATYLSSYGYSEKSFKHALMDFYERKETVNQVMTIAKIYGHFQTLNLDKRVFPLPVEHNYSYRSTWGVSRGWGGRRIHEGTDLFASYGVPVRATNYGQVEVMGWNDYGGWRVGLRDVHNTYHYYAHLSGFNKEVK